MSYRFTNPCCRAEAELCQECGCMVSCLACNPPGRCLNCGTRQDAPGTIEPAPLPNLAPKVQTRLSAQIKRVQAAYEQADAEARVLLSMIIEKEGGK